MSITQGSEPIDQDALALENLDSPFAIPLAEIVSVTNGLDMSYRCDRCGAQAYVEVQLRPTVDQPNPSDLYFCAHHYHHNKAKIIEAAAKIVEHLAWLQEEERRFKGGIPV